MGDTPVATLRPSGSSIAIYYVHVDHLNTVIKVSQPSNNQLTYRWDPDAWGAGNLLPNQNPSGLGVFVYNLALPGMYLDIETKLFQNYFRDYSSFFGRYAESDPIGLYGGINTYAYVSGNPVSNSDPSGLAQFGYRPLSGLPWLYIFSRNALDDFFNTDLAHEQLFFEDGLNPSNVGFFPGGLQSGEDPSQYHMDPMHYDDAVMRQAVANVNPGKYSLPTNNCQTYDSSLRAEYNRLQACPNVSVLGGDKSMKVLAKTRI